ncbi:hypothetical protein AZO1586I_1985 [Bathymodiolus thermophilus thioautotrophic gill symbiont]|uniref:Uncharacterized protein n=1 Tax=Bathymodiolus thermophilus thioautotrophic gill symbiont TaxID=2360 RepID=A0ABM8MBA8_9GAMM|nr:hypothetical protein AZO1586I_1985 [Bathymodiolus thermophilus thioautotrophic gill symbiont]
MLNTCQVLVSYNSSIGAKIMATVILIIAVAVVLIGISVYAEKHQHR